VDELADATGSPAERILGLCEHLRRRGLVDVTLAPSWDLAVQGDPPSISVIIPCKDRETELDSCLRSLEALEYPRERFEVIVVDDGSEDASAEVAGRHGWRVIRNERNRGQSFSRNLAASRASGEILAFVDSDCFVHPDWLSLLVPYFVWPRVAAVGGYVAGHGSAGRVDRYEAAMSSLNMGEHLVIAGDDEGMFYVPTCNLLVRRECYMAVGGIREDLRVGEDVDLCWRIRKAGGLLLYSPTGVVEHRHRARLSAMVRRRAQYGTSEALLHDLHRDKCKRLALSQTALATLAVLAAGVLVDPRLLPLVLLPPLVDGLRRRSRVARQGVGIAARWVWFAVLRGHLLFVYVAAFHLVRYYLLVLVAAGFIYRPIWLLAGAALVYSAVVEYHTRRPQLGRVVFALLYTAEHLAYQVGVAVGCLRRRSPRSYRLSLARPRGGVS
jgi:mycofactocin glycosyltransferase